MGIWGQHLRILSTTVGFSFLTFGLKCLAWGSWLVLATTTFTDLVVEYGVPLLGMYSNLCTGAQHRDIVGSSTG